MDSPTARSLPHSSFAGSTGNAVEQAAANVQREFLALTRLEEGILAKLKSRRSNSYFSAAGPAAGINSAIREEEDDLHVDPDAGPSEARLRRLEAIRKRTHGLLKQYYGSGPGNSAVAKEASKRREKLLEDTSRLLNELSNPPSLGDLLNSSSPSSSSSSVPAEQLLREDPRLQFDENTPPDVIAAAEKLHAHTVLALQSDHDWWRVYSPYLAQTTDIRRAHVSFPTVNAAGADGGSNGPAADVVPPLVPGAPGYRSLHLRRGLTPDLRLPLQPQVKEVSLLEALSIPGAPAVAESLRTTPLFRLADRDDGAANANGNDKDKETGADDRSGDNPLRLIAERDVTDDGFTMDPRLNTIVDDRAASDWWIAYSCSAPPRRHLHLAHASNENDKRQLVAAPLSLPDAMQRLGVIDPWSQAAAVIDPQAAANDLRRTVSADASATTGAATAGAVISQFALGKSLPPASAIGNGGAGVGPVSEDEITALLSLELSSAPALDYYSSTSAPPLAAYGTASTTSATGASDEQGQASPVAATVSAAPPLGGGFGGTVATPALAAPGEGWSARVKRAYEALKRQLPDIDMLLAIPGSMAALRQDVSARRIQRAWRGRQLMRLARGELEERKRQAKAQALTKLAAVQDAVVQFCRVMENAVGVDLGSDALLASSTATATSQQLRHSGLMAVKAEASRSVTASVSQFLSDTLAGVSRNAIAAAQDVIADKRPRNAMTASNAAMSTMMVARPPLPSTSTLMMDGATMMMRGSAAFGVGGDADAANAAAAVESNSVLAYALSNHHHHHHHHNQRPHYLSYNQVRSGTVVQERERRGSLNAASTSALLTGGGSAPADVPHAETIAARDEQQPQAQATQQQGLQQRRSKSSIFRSSTNDAAVSAEATTASTNEALLFPLAKAVLSYQPPSLSTAAQAAPAATIGPASSSSSAGSLFSPGVVVMRPSSFPINEADSSNAVAAAALGATGGSVVGIASGGSSGGNSLSSTLNSNTININNQQHGLSNASNVSSVSAAIRPLVLAPPSMSSSSVSAHAAQAGADTPLAIAAGGTTPLVGGAPAAGTAPAGLKPLVLNLPGPAYRPAEQPGSSSDAAAAGGSPPTPTTAHSHGSTVTALEETARSGYVVPGMPRAPLPLKLMTSAFSDVPQPLQPAIGTGHAPTSSTMSNSSGSTFDFPPTPVTLGDGSKLGGTFGSTLLGRELQFVMGGTLTTPQNAEPSGGAGAASRYGK